MYFEKIQYVIVTNFDKLNIVKLNNYGHSTHS